MSDLTKHQIYEAVEVLFNTGAVLLLEHEMMESQFMGLVWRGSRIDHLPNEHDDFCNAVGGAVHLASKNKTTHFGFPIAVGHVPKFGDGNAQDSRGGYYVGARPWPTGNPRGVDPWGKLPK
ncbi:MAG TPA: hypothetical protein VFY96_05970 [Candidatus Binatia bacterium]|nr:hypothetical protein [Candidatus Binatia bacterium]